MKREQILLLFLLSSPLFCFGSDWYVENGSQGGDGSENKPFGNFQDALNAAGDGDTIIGYGGSYPADKNVNLMMKQGEISTLSFLSKTKDDFTMVEIDLSDQTVPFLVSASDSNVVIDSYKYFNHDSGEILDFMNGGRVEVKNCEFSNNYVSEHGSCIVGSGVGLNDALTIRNSNFSNNGNTQAGYGSAIHSLWNVMVYDSHFEMNKAVSGGAIYSTGQNLIQNSSFTNNYVSSLGGALYLHNPPICFVNESLFQDNEADDSGGGICIINDNANAQILATNIENTNIYNNKCGSNTTQGDGAGIYIKNKNPISVKVRNVTFEGNEIIEGEGGRGGGLAIEGNGAILTHLSFSGNIAAFGGGLAIIGSSEVTELRDVIFYNNSAKNYGGGYYCLLSNCSLAGIYQDNQAKYGGGVAVDQSALTNLYQAYQHVFYNNSAEMGGGMALLMGTNGIQGFLNFTENSASKYGGAIYANQTGAITCGSFYFNDNSAQEGSNSYLFYGEGPMNNTDDRIVFNAPVLLSTTLNATFLMDNNIKVDIIFFDYRRYLGFSYFIKGQSTVNLCSNGPLLQGGNSFNLILNGGNFLSNVDVSFVETFVYALGATIEGSSDCQSIYGFPKMYAPPTFIGSINIEKGSIQGDNIAFSINSGYLVMEEYTEFFTKGKIEISGLSSIIMKRNSTLNPQDTSFISPSGHIYLEDNTTVNSKVALVRDTNLVINRSSSIHGSQPPNFKTITFDGTLTFLIDKKDELPVSLMTYTQHSGKFHSVTNSSYHVTYEDSALLLHSGAHPLWELIVFCVVGGAVLIAILVGVVWFGLKKCGKKGDYDMVVNEERRLVV